MPYLLVLGGGFVGGLFVGSDLSKTTKVLAVAGVLYYVVKKK